MTYHAHDIGALIKPIQSVRPQAGTAAINGVSIDRQGFGSCVLHLAIGATTGTPTSFTANAKLQHSDDGSTGWADITGAAVTQLTAVNTESRVDVNLRTAKRYIRAVVTPAFVGGTSPTLQVAGIVTLGGPDILPTT